MAFHSRTMVNSYCGNTHGFSFKDHGLFILWKYTWLFIQGPWLIHTVEIHMAFHSRTMVYSYCGNTHGFSFKNHG